ncbi:YktB family protein [Tepidibacillus infernus]|uniref:YktB family protein n=1 Tax=Tepidibacillus TaxID=1494427 RepID=UPI0008534B30|nr:DUF1054 domain-containing protein [Tepidibacillus sp. HK-1]GBF11084.1 hypothetical protein HK1_01102 [Tepidibacillus sp. HK-1]
MNFVGFSNLDFDVFQIDGLEPRMEGIKQYIRPKLELIGQEMAPYLSVLTGQEMFYHVAKHARRTKNPPNDTWVAFAPSKRGYKAFPHFQVGLWSTHLFIWFALIYEAPYKKEFGENLVNHLTEIFSSIPSEFAWSMDHTKPEVLPHKDLTKEELFQMAEKLKKVKKAELLCGITIDRNDPILTNKEQLFQKIENTFETLMPLYQLATKA